MDNSAGKTCSACEGRGWLLRTSEEGHRTVYQIQRCEACQSDGAAFEAAEKALQKHLGPLRFVDQVSKLKHEGEPDEAGPFEPVSEDAVATLNSLILQARKVLGTADECSQCGEVVPYVIGCPNGAEVCQDCFAAGREDERLSLARTTRETIHGNPGERRILPANTLVAIVPADNLPADSAIRYWASPVDGHPWPPETEAWARDVGVGLDTEDVSITPGDGLRNLCPPTPVSL